MALSTQHIFNKLPVNVLFWCFSFYAGTLYVQLRDQMPTTKVTTSDGGNGVRIVCWVNTATPSHHKALAVKHTWAARCDKVLYLSDSHDVRLPTLVLVREQSKEYSWAKSRAAFAHIWQHYGSHYDYFMRVDDDTYVIVDNLRHLLRNHSPSAPVWFGCEFRTHGGFMSGGAGYVLSREALRRFVQQALPNATGCNQNGHITAEDVEMGRCLSTVGVRAVDTRDAEGRYRFLPFAPASHLIPSAGWQSYFDAEFRYKIGQSGNCCSPGLVSFHHVTPNDMRVLHFLLYQLNVQL